MVEFDKVEKGMLLRYLSPEDSFPQFGGLIVEVAGKDYEDIEGHIYPVIIIEDSFYLESRVIFEPLHRFEYYDPNMHGEPYTMNKKRQTHCWSCKRKNLSSDVNEEHDHSKCSWVGKCIICPKCGAAGCENPNYKRNGLVRKKEESTVTFSDGSQMNVITTIDD